MIARAKVIRKDIPMPNINPQEHLTSDLFGSTVTSGTSSGFSSLIAATPGPEILYFDKISFKIYTTWSKFWNYPIFLGQKYSFSKFQCLKMVENSFFCILTIMNIYVRWPHFPPKKLALCRFF